MTNDKTLETLRNRIKDRTYGQVAFVGTNKPLSALSVFSPESKEGKSLIDMGMMCESNGKLFHYFYNEVPKVRKTKKDLQVFKVQVARVETSMNLSVATIAKKTALF